MSLRHPIADPRTSWSAALEVLLIVVTCAAVLVLVSGLAIGTVFSETR